MLVNIRRYFISGLIVFIPFALTIYLFVLSITFFDGLLGKFLEPFFLDQYGFYFRGLSILVGIYLIILTGFFITNFVGKKIYDFFERLLIKLPFFKQVYPALKEIALFLFSRDRLGSFKQVVIIEYPRKGIYSFGFLTNDSSSKVDEKVRKDLCNIFVPSAPGPLTGFVIMVPRKEIIFTEITIEEAFKFIMSGGVVNPV